MNRFTPCLSILPPAQQRLWPMLAQASKLGFVLYGGTAIALGWVTANPWILTFFLTGLLIERPFAQHFPLWPMPRRFRIRAMRGWR